MTLLQLPAIHQLSLDYMEAGGLLILDNYPVELSLLARQISLCCRQLVLEERFSLKPHPTTIPVFVFEQSWQQISTKLLRGLSWQKGRKVIYRNNRK